MRGASEKRTVWIQAAVVVLLLAGGIAALVQNALSPMSRDELKIAAASLRTLSSAAGRLAEQSLDRRLTETFVQQQSSLLYDEVHGSRQDLESESVEPGLEQQHAALVQLAMQTEEQIAGLEDEFGDASAAKNNLEELHSQFKNIEDSLKH